MDRIAPGLLCPTLRADPPADDTVARMLAGTYQKLTPKNHNTVAGRDDLLNCQDRNIPFNTRALTSCRPNSSRLAPMNPKMMLTPTVLSRLAAAPGGAALLALLLRGWMLVACSIVFVFRLLLRWQLLPAVAARGAA